MRRPRLVLPARRRCPTALALCAALALAGCGGGSHTDLTTVASSNGRTAPARPTPRRPAPRRPAAGAASGIAALRRGIQRALNGAGPASGAEVYDLTTHRLLLAVRAGTARPPASVEKLYTTTTVLRTLGPGATLQTQILGTGALSPGGVWRGDLYFRGGGDPTLGDAGFNKTYELGYGPSGLQLAQQLQARGIRRVTGHLYGDESLFDRARGGPSTGYRPDTPDFGGELGALTYNHGSVMKISSSPAAFAVGQLAAAMHSLHIAVRASKTTATTPVDAEPLATVSSPPMQILVRLMDVPSDDLFAELLTKQLGVRYGGGEGSITAGADVIADTIASGYGIHPTILDGSGLSHRDRSSPSQVVTLLRELWRTPTGALVLAALPVVGRSGTVIGVAPKTAAVGRCSAKTGTLTDVTNLAGYCRTKGGDELAFAFFDDGLPNGPAIYLEGQMVAAVARF